MLEGVQLTSSGPRRQGLGRQHQFATPSVIGANVEMNPVLFAVRAVHR